MNIMERRKVDIFSICVFNNLRYFLLNSHPLFFTTLTITKSVKPFNFNNINFCMEFAIHR